MLNLNYNIFINLLTMLTNVAFSNYSAAITLLPFDHKYDIVPYISQNYFPKGKFNIYVLRKNLLVQQIELCSFKFNGEL